MTRHLEYLARPRRSLEELRRDLTIRRQELARGTLAGGALELAGVERQLADLAAYEHR